MQGTLQTGSTSIYKRGARDGAVFGAYLSVMFVVSAMSLTAPMLGLFSTVMALAVPVVIYLFLSRGMRADGCRSTFSALWMHGIVVFICGGGIMALVMYVYMRFISPDFIIRQFYTLIEAYDGLDNPSAAKISSMLRQIIAGGMLPTPISVATTTLWLVSFTGSLLSMIEALIVRYVVYKRQKK